MKGRIPECHGGGMEGAWRGGLDAVDGDGLELLDGARQDPWGVGDLGRGIATSSMSKYIVDTPETIIYLLFIYCCLPGGYL